MPQNILYEWKIIFSGSLLHKTYWLVYRHCAKAARILQVTQTHTRLTEIEKVPFSIDVEISLFIKRKSKGFDIKCRFMGITHPMCKYRQGDFM